MEVTTPQEAAYWSIAPTFILSSIMTPEEKLIFVVMSSLLDGDGWWHEDVAQMAAVTGMDEETVSNALYMLQRRGNPVTYENGKYMLFWKKKELEAAKAFYAKT